jgi:hypothetical protein
MIVGAGVESMVEGRELTANKTGGTEVIICVRM